MTDHLQRDTADLPPLLTIGEAATLLRISKTTVRKMIANGTIPTWRPNLNVRTQRIPKTTLLNVIAQSMAKTAA